MWLIIFLAFVWFNVSAQQYRVLDWVDGFWRRLLMAFFWNFSFPSSFAMVSFTIVDLASFLNSVLPDGLGVLVGPVPRQHRLVVRLAV